MPSLEDPLATAQAIARVIQARAKSIVDLGNQISEVPDITKLTPEEWEVLLRALTDLSKELNDEIETFAMKASFA